MSGRYPLDFKPPWASKSEEYLQYAEVYKDTIEFLLEKFSENPPIHDYSLAPVLFLLRQYIELQLKGIIIFCKKTLPKEDKHHKIGPLYKKAIKAVDEKYGKEQLGEANPDVERFIEALSNFDVNGQAFRYPETSKGDMFSERIEKLDGWLYERITTLADFSDVVSKTIGDLEGIEGYLDIMYENEQEEWANQ
jgi:hypothetical protein